MSTKRTGERQGMLAHEFTDLVHTPAPLSQPTCSHPRGDSLHATVPKVPSAGRAVQKREGIEGCVIVTTESLLSINVVQSRRKEFDAVLSKFGKLVRGTISSSRAVDQTGQFLARVEALSSFNSSSVQTPGIFVLHFGQHPLTMLFFRTLKPDRSMRRCWQEGQ